MIRYCPVPEGMSYPNVIHNCFHLKKKNTQSRMKDDSNLEYGCPFYIRRCLEDCWEESPSLRPNANAVFCRLSVMRNET